MPQPLHYAAARGARLRRSAKVVRICSARSGHLGDSIWRGFAQNVSCPSCCPHHATGAEERPVFWSTTDAGSVTPPSGDMSSGAGALAVGPIERIQVPLHARPVTGSHPDLPQDKARLPAPLTLGALAARRGVVGRPAQRSRSSRRSGSSSDCACRCGSGRSFSLISCRNRPTATCNEGTWLFTISHIRSGSISAYPCTMTFLAPITWLHGTSGAKSRVCWPNFPAASPMTSMYRSMAACKSSFPRKPARSTPDVARSIRTMRFAMCSGKSESRNCLDLIAAPPRNTLQCAFVEANRPKVQHRPVAR